MQPRPFFLPYTPISLGFLFVAMCFPLTATANEQASTMTQKLDTFFGEIEWYGQSPLLISASLDHSHPVLGAFFHVLYASSTHYQTPPCPW